MRCFDRVANRDQFRFATRYGGLHQKSWTALVVALTLISEGGPGTGTLGLSRKG